jgi:SAM-dependent methyltransferase
MMFGFRDEFKYIECSCCGCLQLADYPKNFLKYYPSDYFAYQNPAVQKDNFFTRYFRQKWVGYGLTGKGIMGMFISSIKPLSDLYKLFRKYNIGLDAKVLDVGCGYGHFLMILKRGGFSNLLGVDPFLPHDIHCDDSLRLLKRNLKEIDQQFDLITLQHSFEHMPDPTENLKRLHDLLTTQGILMITVPVLGNAWEYYGVNWVGLDAPRHLFIHTSKSMDILCENTGFLVSEFSYQVDELYYWGSEQYLRDIPLADKRSYWINPQKSIFSEKEIDMLKLTAQKSAIEGRGDNIQFCLRKSVI